MKAYKKTGKPFTSIIVELESQDEVDFVFALFNYTDISQVAEDANISAAEWRCALEDYLLDYERFHKKLLAKLR